MKKRFLLPLIAFCVIGMTGCDKTVDTSSEEVSSIASSVVEGGLTAKEVVDALVAAGSGTNYTFTDYSDDTTIAYTKEAAYYSYFGDGYITLPDSTGVKGVYNYTKGSDGVIVKGDAVLDSDSNQVTSIAGGIDNMAYAVDVESGYAEQFTESNFEVSDGVVTTTNPYIVGVLEYATAYGENGFTSAEFVQADDSLDITLRSDAGFAEVNLGLIGSTELLDEEAFMENYVAPTYIATI